MINLPESVHTRLGNCENETALSQWPNMLTWKKEADMERKAKRTSQTVWIRRYRFWLAALLVVIIMLMGWYCLDSYRQTAIPREGTLVDGGKQYERKA